MLNFKYISSTGVEFDLLTFARLVTDCNAFDYEYSPVTFGKRFGAKIYGFEMEYKKIEATFYVFGDDRKEQINEMTAAFDYDVQNESIGTLICNGYSIPAYSIGASDASNNSSSLLWDTFKRVFICPYPFWSKQTFFKLFETSDTPPTFTDIKDYLPVSEDGKADYQFDYMTNVGSTGRWYNNDLTGSEWSLVINGYAENPVIHINDMIIALDLTIQQGETLTIDSRNKTLILTEANGFERNVFGNRDVSVDIFKRIPRGQVDVWWDSNFTWTITTYDERTAPLWN